MATFTKVDSFVEALAEKKHDLGTDVLKFMLTNSAPIASNTVLANLTEIAAANGYTAGGTAVSIASSSQTAGTYSLVAADVVVFTASGGTIGAFRYVVLYNDTALNDELISFYDYGSSITLADTETFTITIDSENPGATLLTLV